MRLPLQLAGLSLPLSLVTAATTNLYVSSYDGTITSLQLAQSTDGSYELSQIAVSNGSAPNPSWLTKDPINNVLYCVDEGLSVPNGSLASYSTSPSGELTQIDRHSVISGPVSSVVYNKGQGLAVAHYSGSALTSWSILPSGGVEPLQEFPFTLSAPGPDPSRQDSPHPHEALVDPTDSFILVPDLGADFVRIYSIDPCTSMLTEQTPFEAVPGSGPRHGSFVVSGNTTYFFLVTELGNTITSYKLNYGPGPTDLSLTEVFTSGVLGNQTVPTGAAVAENIVTPDGKYVLTSLRNAPLFNIPNWDPSNSTEIASDSLQSWIIDPATGALTFDELAPAGGSYPRQFSVNKDGSLAAVGLQYGASVAIIARNVEDGTWGDFVAEIGIPGQITSVIFDD